ncbi:MAG: PAS domain-containing protein [Cyclobacteriaceae bacterium]
MVPNEFSSEKKTTNEPDYAIVKEILGACTDIVLIFDDNLNVCFVNKYALDLLNYGEDDLLGQHITQIFPKRQHQMLESINESVEAGLKEQARRKYLNVRGKKISQ